MEPILDHPGDEEIKGDYAGFWMRFLAAVIDGILLQIVSKGLLALGFFSVAPISYNYEMYMSAILSTESLFSIVIAWLYGALMESSSWQATLGKRAVGLVVTDMNGSRISFARATGRHFAKIISALILLIGYIMAGFTDKKQALHDLVAGTLVYKIRGV